MDVLPRLERLAQRLILTHRRKNAELNLDVVGRQELPSLPRDERFADLPPLLRSNGDVLQVRVRRRKPSCGGHRLVEARMHPLGLGMDERTETVDIEIGRASCRERVWR